MNEAEMHYIVNNIGDIGLALEGMATYLILVEAHLRMYSKGLQKSSFKQLINEFFEKIYLERFVVTQSVLRVM